MYIYNALIYWRSLKKYQKLASYLIVHTLQLEEKEHNFCGGLESFLFFSFFEVESLFVCLFFLDALFLQCGPPAFYGKDRRYYSASCALSVDSETMADFSAASLVRSSTILSSLASSSFLSSSSVGFLPFFPFFLLFLFLLLLLLLLLLFLFFLLFLLLLLFLPLLLMLLFLLLLLLLLFPLINCLLFLLLKFWFRFCMPLLL